MTISGTGVDPESPLLDGTVDGSTDHKGGPARRSTSGRWRSAYFIICVEVAERFAYHGIQANLINYLTGRLGLSMAAAAENVNTWTGTGTLLPLLGAFVADSYLGRYRTIVTASLLYILGLVLLTLSAVLPSGCQNYNQTTPCSPPLLQIVLFFFSLYLVAVGMGGHKPCNQAFGADQFDGRNPEESIAKNSFFNWWYFGLCFGGVTSYIFLSYVQENLNWGLGFGIPCIVMTMALLIFLLGTKTYRYSAARKDNEKSPFVRIGKVFIAAARNWRTTPSLLATEDQSARGTPHDHQVSQQFKCLNKALLTHGCSKENGGQCTIDDIEEAKAALRLFPIWATCLGYAIVFAQSSTFFTKQGLTMERSIGWGINIPASSLQAFIGLSTLVIIPIYDRILVPIARTFTGKPSGITMLQRIGTGMFLSAIAMVVAALVEAKRLETAQEHGLVDKPDATLPMSIWWLLPQYILFGVSHVFTMVGLQEFFYEQVPTELRSVGIALYLSIFGVGNFLSSLLISTIEKATGGDGQHSWFNDNLNLAHLDYYYWVLAGVTGVGLSFYLYFAKSYIYYKGSTL